MGTTWHARARFLPVIVPFPRGPQWRAHGRCPAAPSAVQRLRANSPDNARVSLHRGNLFLIGLMGAGKSTLGRQIARRLGLAFVDADIELERRLGVSIPTMFEIEGEKAFRDREEALIDELTQRTSIVLATGGGAVGRPGSRKALQERGTVLYLHAQPATLYERVKHGRNRPMLKVADPLARITSLYAERDPLYREIADHVIESERDRVLRFARSLMPASVDHGAGPEPDYDPEPTP